ncbi:MAG: DUF4861 domain-containing protein [Bacteroidia bacterium]|nr:DUF4861 domain-containing protein [Bacteroidia bacterium]
MGVCLWLVVIACMSQEQKDFPSSFDVTVTNPTEFVRYDVMALVPADQLEGIEFNPEAFIVMLDDREIPSQYVDAPQDGIAIVLDSLTARQAVSLQVRYNPSGKNVRQYPKRTQAELSHKFNGTWNNREYEGGEFRNVGYMRVPSEHKDHSWFIRYEGPGWESDKVGYRFYLDQRNATDVFGKKVTEPVLQHVGLEGFDSYHEMQSWGMDVMKVGKSLGIGSIGAWLDSAAIRVERTDSLTCSITDNGPVYSSITTTYSGWKAGTDTVDVNSVISIHAGTRITRQHLSLSTDMDNLCTGLVKDEKAKLFSSPPTHDSFGYLATFGRQSLNNDNLGIAVLFDNTSFTGFSEDQFSHVVRLQSADSGLTYYFLAAWEGEPGGITDEASFIDHVKVVARELAQPVTVAINH